MTFCHSLPMLETCAIFEQRVIYLVRDLWSLDICSAKRELSFTPIDRSNTLSILYSWNSLSVTSWKIEVMS